MKKVKKILSIIERNTIKSLSLLYNKKYMKYYTRYLKKIGIKIQGNPNFIATSVYFDGADYSKITLGNNVTISREVMLLTHDGSMHTVYKGLQLEKKEQLKEQDLKNSLITIKEISIGENSFIGARSSILPGTSIGKNVLVGACSVVKGNIPDNSIIVGNPAKVIGKTNEWIEKNTEYVLY